MVKPQNIQNREELFLNYPLFKEFNLIHFTTTIRGGVSQANYSSMNPCLYCRDNVEDVMENRNLLAGYVGVAIENLIIPYQTHENKIRVIDKDFLNLSHEDRERHLNGIDALITQEKGVCIGITTADCVPVLIYDPVNHVLGTAHAGWKGTVQRIGAKTAKRMKERFSSNYSDLIVAIGPSISQEMFEVGDEVGDAFTEENFDLNAISYRSNISGKLHIDLWKANRLQLLDLGVKEENIEIAGICTYKDRNYFSARRQTINSGRMLTGGVLK